MNRDLSEIESIVVHCAATPWTMDIGRKEIDAWHRDRGFDSVGYHAIIRLNGDVEFGRPLDVVGAHTRGFNERSIGICLVGGLGGEAKYSQEQFNALRLLIHGYMGRFGELTLYGHREFNSQKTCPNFDVRHWFTWDEV